MSPSTIDYLAERARMLKARRPPEDHDGAMLCALLEDICLAMRQLNAEMEAGRNATAGTKRALLNYTGRKRS